MYSVLESACLSVSVLLVGLSVCLFVYLRVKQAVAVAADPSNQLLIQGTLTGWFTRQVSLRLNGTTRAAYPSCALAAPLLAETLMHPMLEHLPAKLSSIYGQMGVCYCCSKRSCYCR